MSTHATVKKAGPISLELYFATRCFILEGGGEQTVLKRLALTRKEWKILCEAYDLFWIHDGWDSKLKELWPDLSAQRLHEELLRNRWGFPQSLASLDDVISEIRDAVLTQSIGPFPDMPRPHAYIAGRGLNYFSHDGHQVFRAGQPLADKKGTPFDLDVGAFRAVGERYFTDGRTLLGYCIDGRGYWWPLVGADLNSFVVLNERYAKDAEKAWYITGKLIRTNSPSAFEIVPDLRLNYRDMAEQPMVLESSVARDAQKVYSYGAAVRHADPATFRALGHDYWSDGKLVWTSDGKRLLEDADAQSFIVPGPLRPSIVPEDGEGTYSDASDRKGPFYRGVRRAIDDSFMKNWREFFLQRDDAAQWWWGKQGR